MSPSEAFQQGLILYHRTRKPQIHVEHHCHAIPLHCRLHTAYDDSSREVLAKLYRIDKLDFILNFETQVNASK